MKKHLAIADVTRRIFASTTAKFCVVIGSVCSTNAIAAWPEDAPIKIIVAQPAGGTNDTVARLIGEALAKALNQSVVIENRPGGSGALGMQALTQAKPDGYTLGIGSDGSALIDAVRPKNTWKFRRDLTGVAMIGDVPVSIAVSGKSPFYSWADVLKFDKTNPGQINFGSSGAGTGQHIVGEWLGKLAGVSLTHIPYKGGGQASLDLISGQVPMAVLGLVPMLPQHKRGTVRILAVTTSNRSAALPDVPTLTELGYPQIALSQWVGVMAPAGTPPAVVSRLSEELLKIVAQPDIVQKLDKSGIVPRPMASAQFSKFIDSEVDNWITLLPTLNLKLD